MLSGSLSAENLIIFDVGEHAGVACGLGGFEVFGNGLGVTDVVDMAALCGLLRGQIAHVLTQDTSVWATEYVCKPSLFIASQESAFYPENRALCAAECAFIDRTQQEDGTWAITWDWGAYPQDWPVCRNWWKAAVIIKNARFVRAMRNE